MNKILFLSVAMVAAGLQGAVRELDSGTEGISSREGTSPGMSDSNVSDLMSNSFSDINIAESSPNCQKTNRRSSLVDMISNEMMLKLTWEELKRARKEDLKCWIKYGLDGNPVCSVTGKRFDPETLEDPS